MMENNCCQAERTVYAPTPGRASLTEEQAEQGQALACTQSYPQSYQQELTFAEPLSTLDAGSVTEASACADPAPAVRWQSKRQELLASITQVKQALPAMYLDSYQRWTDTMATYNTGVSIHTAPEYSQVAPYMYPVLALAEEAGEVAGKVAKYIRKYGDDVDALSAAVLPELGDVLFQVARVAKEFGFTLNEVAAYNIVKLTDRQERDVLVGEGDNR